MMNENEQVVQIPVRGTVLEENMNLAVVLTRDPMTNSTSCREAGRAFAQWLNEVSCNSFRAALKDNLQ